MIIKEIVEEMVQEHYAYISDCERDATQREEVIAKLRMQTEMLKAQSEIDREYFAGQMKERNRLFASANQVLETAMKRGDAEMARMAIIAIEVVHKKSPFNER